MSDPYSVSVAWEEHGDAGRIATITVDRSAKLNILHSALMGEMIETFKGVSDAEDLRCVILTGAGEKSFIGGADIHAMTDLGPKTARSFISRLHSVCQAIRDCPVPVIARVNGYCLGAGMEIAAACDMRMASTTAQFGMPEVAVGIPSVIEAALLPRLIGWGKTNEILMTGKIFPAQEAADMHFIEALVPPEQLDASLGEWTGAILNAGPLAIRSQKRLMARWESLTPDDAIQAGIDAFSDAYTTDEPHVYTQKFLNRDKS